MTSLMTVAEMDAARVSSSRVSATRRPCATAVVAAWPRSIADGPNATRWAPMEGDMANPFLVDRSFVCPNGPDCTVVCCDLDHPEDDEDDEVTYDIGVCQVCGGYGRLGSHTATPVPPAASWAAER